MQRGCRSECRSEAVCCSVLQCVAVCCSVLQCVAVRQCVAVCCRVLQCVAVRQCVAVCCSECRSEAVCCSVLQCVAVCRSEWHTDLFRRPVYNHLSSESVLTVDSSSYFLSNKPEEEEVIFNGMSSAKSQFGIWIFLKWLPSVATAVMRTKLVRSQPAKLFITLLHITLLHRRVPGPNLIEGNTFLVVVLFCSLSFPCLFCLCF